MERIIELGGWRVRCDVELNRSIYARIPMGAPEQCTCAQCKLFVRIRDEFYSVPVRRVFEQFGIDYRKEAEVVLMGDNGELARNGWYNFVGQIDQDFSGFHIIDNLKIQLRRGGQVINKEFHGFELCQLEWFWPKDIAVHSSP